jgi:hypothetical protein
MVPGFLGVSVHDGGADRVGWALLSAGSSGGHRLQTAATRMATTIASTTTTTKIVRSLNTALTACHKQPIVNRLTETLPDFALNRERQTQMAIHGRFQPGIGPVTLANAPPPKPTEKEAPADRGSRTWIWRFSCHGHLATDNLTFVS